MLPVLLKPTGRPQQSVSDAQNCFFAHFKEATLMDTSEEPRVVLLGSTVFDIEQIVVNFRGRNNNCSQSLQALDTVYKLIWVLDKRYPKAAHNVYVFIQRLFYETFVENQACSPDVNRITKILQEISKA